MQWTDFWGAIDDDDTAVKVAVRFAALCFFHMKDGPQEVVRAADVEQIVKDLQIDIEAAWLGDMGGPMLEPILRAYTKDGLLKLLTQQWKLTCPAGESKENMIKLGLAQRPKPDDKLVGPDMPKEIAKAKKPK